MGVSAETQDPDLATAFAGGDTFIQRMEQLSAAKLAAEKAEASLNLGMSAKAAIDLYQGKLADADRALADARKQALAIVDEAKATAAVAIKDGEDQRATAQAQANDVRVAAETYAVETRAGADTAMQTANRANNEASAKLAQLDAIQKAADDKVAAADEARAASTAAEAKFNDAIDTLRTACAKVLATG